jgi:phosphate transport system protein
MVDHIVKSYDEALDQLMSDVARMGGLAEAQVTECINAVVRRDTLLARSLIDRDVKVDEAHALVEKRATTLLALRQPLAQDLRAVVSAWKIANELERVGDLARNIAKRTLVLNQSEPIQLTRSIERMGRIASGHLKQVLDAYAAGDIRPALAVWLQDEEVDAHYNSLFRELLTYMMEDPRTIGPCAHLLFVAKNIERIGDHCTNIAENVHYFVTGEPMASSRPKSDESDRTADF